MTDDELELIAFLEWLDTEGEVINWRDDTTTHWEVAQRYLREMGKGE